MKKTILLSFAIVSVMIVSSCKKSSDNASNTGGSSTNSDVRVETYTPQDITATTAVCGGDAIVTQGLSLTEIGVCWSTSINPTIEEYHWSTTAWDEPYVCTLEYLTPNTKYYVRAYALRGLEYYYGATKSFTTGDGVIEPTPEGAISGIFSISEGNRIYFSKGNLQYKASNDTWRFAENQWDYVGTQTPDYFGNMGGTIAGSDNSLISTSYNGWIDLFGFGTGVNPTNTSSNANDYAVFDDWGNNTILNGGNIGIWRTMGKDEWNYILNIRQTTSGIRYIKAQIIDSNCTNIINGIIILPDYWKKSTYNFININGGQFDSNQIYISDFEILETQGAVFLPAAGRRIDNHVMLVCSMGYYWTATHPYDEYAWYMNFDNTNIYIPGDSQRCWGYSVRLVQDAY